MKSCLLTTILAFASLLTSHASMLVSLDTSGLIGNPAGPFYLDFQFNDGTGANDNLVKITNINLGGGTVLGPAALFGGVSGDLLSGITLTDSDPFNEFFQSFSAGTYLSFQLSMTNLFTGSVPDVFGFAILDANLYNLATYSLGSDQLLIATLDSTGPVIETFASVDGSVPAPHIPDTGNTLLLTTLAMGALAMGRRLTRRSLATATGSAAP
jgi:hypothetical protein